jgi:predicted site-specific integrase-resolvase
VPDKNHKDLEKQVKELTEANEKLKAELESERESFEIALDNAEKWHKEKLEFRDEEIAEKNDRIKHLERLLFNVSMSSKLTELENKVKNLENKIEIPPK